MDYLNSVGNLAPIPFEENRAKNADANWDYYNNNSDKLYFAQDWISVRNLFSEVSAPSLMQIYKDSFFIKLLHKGTLLNSSLGQLWRRNGHYSGAADAVKEALTREHFASSATVWRGVNVMTIHKSKGKEFNEVIEVFDTKGFSLEDFAGQDDIKTYFKEVVIDAIRNDDLDIVPKGVMLMGPPGTGKTFFARCLAGDAGINFVEFKMSKILGKYVGESEKSMEKALSVFRALAPVGVFMDEIDQSLSRGKGDDGGSSVNSNIFGMLLAEMSKPENRGKILWMAATNYPNNVDEALKRAGRFDKKIPYLTIVRRKKGKIFSFIPLKRLLAFSVLLFDNGDVGELLFELRDVGTGLFKVLAEEAL